MRHADGSTLLSRRLLDVMRERGDWMSGTQLADATHSKGPTHYQARLLQSMAKQGLIEIRPPNARKWQRVLYEKAKE